MRNWILLACFVVGTFVAEVALAGTPQVIKLRGGNIVYKPGNLGGTIYLPLNYKARYARPYGYRSGYPYPSRRRLRTNVYTNPYSTQFYYRAAPIYRQQMYPGVYYNF